MAPPSGNASKPGRTLAVLVALIVAMFLGVVGSDLGSPGKWRHDFQVHLGLDLTSGTTVALQAVKPGGGQPSGSEMQQAVAIMDNRVNGAGFTGAQVTQQGSNIITVAVPGQNAQSVVNLVSRTAELFFRQVLLVAPNTSLGGTTPTPGASAAPSPTGPAGSTPAPSPSATGSPKAAASPSSSAHAAGLPGAGSGTTQEMAARAQVAASPSASATATAQAASPPPSASAAATPSPSPSASAAPTSGLSTWQQASGDPTLVSAAVKAKFNKLNCASKNWQQTVGYNAAQWDDPKIQIVACGKVGGVWEKYALDKAPVTGTMVSSASAGLDPNSANSWVVNLNFNSAGTNAFEKLTAQMYAKYQGSRTLAQNDLAVVLDGEVVSAPYISNTIPNGQALISGNFSQQSAQQLATQLSYGHLPLSFHPSQAQSISPQLGHDQLTAGLIAAAIGLGLVVLYLLFYYRGLAVVAVFSLAIAALLSYLSVILLGNYRGFTLSLAGIAGLIVAIGITADSFVVYFERLRDEVREGRSLRAAVERGWSRARRTILVSDTVSFLAAALLWIFAIGDVRGFAFTLGLTTVIDVVVVFTFTKPMMTLLARTKFYGGGHPLSGLDPGRLGARAPWRGTRRPAAARTTSAKEA